MTIEELRERLAKAQVKTKPASNEVNEKLAAFVARIKAAGEKSKDNNPT